MAAGAHFNAQKAGSAFVKNVLRRSAVDVEVMEGGPRRPGERTQMSRRPKALRHSSMRVRVASSVCGERG